jgi:hypothetical protein
LAQEKGGRVKTDRYESRWESRSPSLQERLIDAREAIKDGVRKLGEKVVEIANDPTINVLPIGTGVVVAGRSVAALARTAGAGISGREFAIRDLGTLLRGPNAAGAEGREALETLKELVTRGGNGGRDSIAAMVQAGEELGLTNTPAANQAIRELLSQRFTHPNTQWGLMNGLARRTDPEAIQMLADVARSHPFASLREHALARLMQNPNNREAAKAVRTALDSGAVSDRLFILERAAANGDAGLLMRGLKNADTQVSQQSARLLVDRLKNPHDAAAVREALRNYLAQPKTAENPTLVRYIQDALKVSR